MVKQRFFIALLPPQNIQDSANDIKQYFADQYNSRSALKSPPHVTLQPPFEWEIDQLETLKNYLASFAQQHLPIPMTLSGFNAFPPKVIYIDVIQTPELLALQRTLTKKLESDLQIIDQKGKTRAFTPHLTVAFRDLKNHHFHPAWSEFKDRPFQANFVISHLTLLLHNGERWNIYQEFPLIQSSP